MSEFNWKRESKRHLQAYKGAERLPVCIVRVDSTQQVRYEVYADGKYLGWRETAEEAKTCAQNSSISA